MQLVLSMVSPVLKRHRVGVRKTTLASLVAPELDDVAVPQPSDPRNVATIELWKESSCIVVKRLANNLSQVKISKLSVASLSSSLVLYLTYCSFVVFIMSFFLNCVSHSAEVLSS